MFSIWGVAYVRLSFLFNSILLEDSTPAATSARESETVKIILNFKYYIYDPQKRMIQW